MLNSNDIIPMYKQLQDDLKNRIKNGEYKARERIPSEKNLTQMYGVSIITVRKAISELVEEGILEKKQGKGTFVSAVKLQRNLQQVISFSEACRLSGTTPGSKLLERKLITPTNSVLEKLGCQSGDKVVFLSRLRFVNGEPVVIETNQFPIAYSFLLEEDLVDKSLFEILKQKMGITVQYSKREIKIVRATSFEAELLQVPKNEPLLLQRTLALSGEGKPVFVGSQLINSERYHLTF